MEREDTTHRLHELLNEGTMPQVRHILSGLHPAEIGQLLESLPIPKRRVVWELLPSEGEGEILKHVSDEVAANLIEMTNDSDLLLATEGLETDDLADLLADLPDAVTAKALAAMDQQHRQRVEKIMTYPEGTAGALMNTDTVAIRDHVNLDTVLRYLRTQEDIPRQTNSLMVVDYSNHYIGRLALRDVVTKNPDALVKDFLDTSVDPIVADESIEKVAKLFEDLDLVSSAVVDEQGLLIGRITIDDVVDVIREETQKERIAVSGVSGEEDLFAPIPTAAQKRALWLGVNLCTALIAAWVISLFQDTLEKAIALAILIPVVASMGGIAGYQTLTIIIRGIANGRIVKENSRLLMRREISIGLLNGVFWAAVVSLIVVLWFDNASIGLIIGGSMVATLLLAAIAGVSVPPLLRKMGVDPALAGGVVLTTITDVVGIFTFLGLASWYLL